MDLEHKAIARLQEAAKLSEFYYQKPLLLTCSGGKDSEWAQGAPAWEGKDDCCLSSHPGLVDLLASQVRLLERQREQASPLQGQER